MIEPELLYPGNRYIIEFQSSIKTGIFTGEIKEHIIVPKIIMNGKITSKIVFYGFKNIFGINHIEPIRYNSHTYFFPGNSIDNTEAKFKLDTIIRQKDKENKQANIAELRDYIQEKKIEPYGPSDAEYESRISFFGELYREAKSNFINNN